MTEEPETEEPELTLDTATVSDLPPVFQLLGSRNLVPVRQLVETLIGFTLTGAMVTVRPEGRAPMNPRRLSHFVPDMLTRLAIELGPVGLVEVEISEPRLPTRGFAFFLEPALCAELAPAPPEPEKSQAPEYPDSEAGRMMRNFELQLQAMMAPLLLRMDQMQANVDQVLFARSEQNKRAEIFAEIMDEEAVARARAVLSQTNKSPQEAFAENMKEVKLLMETASSAKKELAAFAPKTDPDAAKLEKLLDFAESPRAGALFRGLLRLAGGDVGAPVDSAPVTAEAKSAARELPKLFVVDEKETA